MVDSNRVPNEGDSRQELLRPQHAFLELSQLIVGSRPFGEVLMRVVQLTRACVPGADEVSVTLVEGESNTRTAAFTGSLATHLDERQYQVGFGPCLDAAVSGQTIRLENTATDDTYAEFAATAARQGVQNVVSVGMPMPQRILGAINVYRFDPEVLNEESVQVLQAFAGYAAIALANHSLYATATALNGHMQTAMQSRAIIEQAKGVIISRRRCTAEEAFQQLTRQSQTSNRKLREIAAEVVAHA